MITCRLSIICRISLVMLLVFFFSLPAVAAKKKTTRTTTPSPATTQPKIVQIDYSELVKKVLPAVVKIKTESGSGSGFFVSDKGEILTNYHVIENARKVSVILNSGEVYSAWIQDVDGERDMALLTVNMKSPHFLNISSKLPRQGETIMVAGNPQGLDFTVSNGIISAFRGNNTWVQFTAPVSPGSSGGALVNINGEVVGMPTFGYVNGQNLNFAIASTVLREFIGTARREVSASSVPPNFVRSNIGEQVDGYVYLGRDTDGNEHYVDSKSTSISDNVINFWERCYVSDEYKRNKIASSRNAEIKDIFEKLSFCENHMEIDLWRNVYRIVGYIYYSSTSEGLYNYAFPYVDWSNILPNSFIEQVREVVVRILSPSQGSNAQLPSANSFPYNSQYSTQSEYLHFEELQELNARIQRQSDWQEFDRWFWVKMMREGLTADYVNGRLMEVVRASGSWLYVRDTLLRWYQEFHDEKLGIRSSGRLFP